MSSSSESSDTTPQAPSLETFVFSLPQISSSTPTDAGNLPLPTTTPITSSEPNDIQQSADNLKQALICNICAETFYQPITLICQHTFCKKCLIKMETRKCPVCRVRFVIPKEHNRLVEDMTKIFFSEEWNKLDEEWKAEQEKKTAAERIRDEVRDALFNEIVDGSLEEVNRDIVMRIRSERNQQQETLPPQQTTPPSPTPSGNIGGITFNNALNSSQSLIETAFANVSQWLRYMKFDRIIDGYYHKDHIINELRFVYLFSVFFAALGFIYNLFEDTEYLNLIFLAIIIMIGPFKFVEYTYIRYYFKNKVQTAQEQQIRRGPSLQPMRGPFPLVSPNGISIGNSNSPGIDISNIPPFMRFGQN